MYKISEFIKNIQEKGNCKVYMPSEKNSNFVIDITVNEKGMLSAKGVIETYDEPYWNGKIKNENANLVESIKAFDYKKEELDVALANIVVSSLDDSSEYLLTSEENLSKTVTNSAVSNICCKVQSMLNLSYYDLTQWVLGSSNSVLNIMINNPLKKDEKYLYNPELAVEYIEMLVSKIDYYLKIVKFNWEVISSSVPGSEEYKEASQNWGNFCNNKKVLK